MCSKDNCEKPVRTNGLCKNHYDNFIYAQRKADGLIAHRIDWSAEDYEQYWKFVKKELNLV